MGSSWKPLLDELRANRPGNTYDAKRKLYTRLLLLTHPDKGGNARAFQNVHDAWSGVRRRFDARPPTREAVHVAFQAAAQAQTAAWPPSFKQGLTAQPPIRPVHYKAPSLGVGRPGLQTRVYDSKADAYVHKTAGLRPRRASRF